MAFVSETVIDQVVEKLGNDEISRAEGLENLELNQPAITGYFFSEGFSVFSQQEREYTLYLLLVIWESFRTINPESIPVDEDQLMEAEDQNWSLIETNKAQRFRDRLDVFFKDYPQEDLLAFVEDALLDEEDEILAKESREPLFVALKSVIDCLLKN